MDQEYYFAKINRWDNPIKIQSSAGLQEGDIVIVETDEGFASAIIQSPDVFGSKPANGKAEHKFVRKANLNDLKIIRERRKKEKESIRIAQKEVKKIDLPIKIVDAAYSFEGGNVTFAFIADGRVDFRELVKNLAKHFQRSVRLHQVGARDESRQSGGYGSCGRELCCVKFKGNLPSITSEMAKIQHIAHRGSERISGICGRLMCCLAYEAEQYKEIIGEYPKIGDEVRYKDQGAVVKELNLLNGNIKIELENKTILIVNKEELK